MHNTNEIIAEKFGLNLSQKSPIEIRNTDRVTLAKLLCDLGFKRGAEIGVESGLYSETLCQNNPGVQLFCVDAWRAYSGYRDHVSQKHLDGFYETAQERLKPYNATLIRQFSLDAVKTFDDASLDFVYIDAAHDIQNVINDIAEWGKKVKPGGIIAGHDYVKYYLPNTIQVVQAVNAWTDSWEIKPWFLLGAQDKVEGELRDTARSWFWVHDPPPAHRKGRKPIKQ